MTARASNIQHVSMCVCPPDPTTPPDCQALALGASTVLLGRPALYALAVGGATGVQQALELLQHEFELAMALSGCVRVSDIGPHLLLRRAHTGLVPVCSDAEGAAAQSRL